jgi:hypothetical protein
MPAAAFAARCPRHKLPIVEWVESRRGSRDCSFPQRRPLLEAQFSACQPFQQERRLFAQPPTMHLARGEPASSQFASWPKEARFRAGAAAASVTSSGEMSSFADMSGAALIAQIAACVRLWTRSFRRIDLTWTFAVASEMASLRAMHLLESP